MDGCLIASSQVLVIITSGEGDEEEEEDEESDPEIDEDDPLFYNCPFCLGLFENKVDMNNHVDGCMPV